MRITWREIWQLETRRARRLMGLLWLAMGIADVVKHLLRGRTASEDFLFGSMYILAGLAWIFIPKPKPNPELISLNLNPPADDIAPGLQGSEVNAKS